MDVLRRAFIVFLSLALAACTTMRPLDAQGSGGRAVAIGDELRIGLRSGGVVELKVTALPEGLIVGTSVSSQAPVSVARADAMSIELREIDTVNSFYAFLLGALLVAILSGGVVLGSP